MRVAVSSRADEGLAAGRIAAGAAAWLLPRLSARVMGLEPAPATNFGLRLFGSRDAALGIAYLQADAGRRDQLLLLGIAIDAADAVAALAAGRSGAMRWRYALPIAATAVAAIATASQIRSSRR